jgi:PleD family two-component response regulator
MKSTQQIETNSCTFGPSPGSAAGRILLIEESTLVVQGYSARLSYAGFEVEVCSIPREAIQRLYCERFDLIILSLQMQQGDYLSILEGLQLWPINRQTPLLALFPKGQRAELYPLIHGGVVQYTERRNVCGPQVIEIVRNMIGTRAESSRPRLRLLTTDDSK